MWAIIAAILFGVALLLTLVGGPFINVLTLGGFLAVALHLALGTGLPWRRQG